MKVFKKRARDKKLSQMKSQNQCCYNCDYCGRQSLFELCNSPRLKSKKWNYIMGCEETTCDTAYCHDTIGTDICEWKLLESIEEC